MSDVFVIGVGMTAFGKFPNRSVKDLTRDSVEQALRDAGCNIADIEAAWFSNTTQRVMEGQYLIPGQIALGAMGFEQIPIINVENACASAGTALFEGRNYLKAGLADVVLVVGAEKMYSEDRDSMFRVFDGGWDVHRADELYAGLVKLGEGMSVPDHQNGGPRSVFMDIYAAMARFHMKTWGTTQRQLAAVSAKNHDHSTMNPLSQYRDSMTIEDVLAARTVCWPLTLPMCAPISDGAAAAVLCTADALKRFNRTRAIRVLASVIGTAVRREPDDVDRHVTRLAALKAYEQAGIGPQDISVAELHDATAFAEIQQTENMGFCNFGEGGVLVESGATRLGGRLPINVSGGLESKGHPIGVTGLAMIHELTLQLRGEAGQRQVADAQFGLAENGGGNNGLEEATACITILGR
ncbi:MAG: thiolase family protein [Planctomycetaceae bacterium]